MPGGNLGPAATHDGVPAPEVGLVVKWSSAANEFQDELGRGWNAALPFRLPDLDVFAIDAATLAPGASYAHVGTALFDIAVNPLSGRLYVTNTDGRNEVRFEGPGTFAGSTVQGRLAQARVTVIDPGSGQVRPVHLNSHLDYSVTPAPAEAKTHSLATPLGAVVSPDGATLFVAAFGSSRVGVLSVAALEAGTFDPRTASGGYLEVSGGGPSGVVLDPARTACSWRRASTTGCRCSTCSPEPRRSTCGSTTRSRPRWWAGGGSSTTRARPRRTARRRVRAATCSATSTGSRGTSAIPTARSRADPIPIRLELFAELLEPNINGTGEARSFHPMKGPMTTQTLRGMVNSGAMHWRGDRAVGIAGEDAFSSDVSFRNFNAAFPDLLGRDGMLSGPDMQAFTDFVLRITLPPNPQRAIDNVLTPAQARGRELFVGPRLMDGIPVPELGFTCEGCHTLDAARGFFGTDGSQSFENETQIVKIAHLRNVYQKIGMFGVAAVDGILSGDNVQTGDQVRASGFLHDGTVDTLFRFLRASVFDEAGEVGFKNDDERRDMEQFLLAFDTDLAPAVGQQVTWRPDSAAENGARADVLRERAGAPFVSKVLGGAVTECDLVAHGVIDGEARGFLWSPVAQRFQSDRAGEPTLDDSGLRARAAASGQAITYTCAPPGSGERMALDRDLDGFFDRDESDAGSDPADAASRPAGCTPSETRLCLTGERFAVTVAWRDAEGATGSAQLVPHGSDDSGLLWFFEPDNWEMLVKVLDGCGINDRFWVFAAATTDVEYTLRVEDTASGEVRDYFNPLGTASPALADTDAFATCGAAAGRSPAGASSPPRSLERQLGEQARRTATLVAGAGASAACPPSGGSALCLAGGRFRVEVDFAASGQDGEGQVVPFGSDDSGLLWFFEPDNWEMLAKVLDGCALNDHFWVFAAATTTVEYTLRVTDTETGAVREYHNTAGTPAPALTDTAAFPCS